MSKIQFQFLNDEENQKKDLDAYGRQALSHFNRLVSLMVKNQVFDHHVTADLGNDVSIHFDLYVVDDNEINSQELH